jgi:hypothetical protein
MTHDGILATSPAIHQHLPTSACIDCNTVINLVHTSCSGTGTYTSQGSGWECQPESCIPGRTAWTLY